MTGGSRACRADQPGCGVSRHSLKAVLPLTSGKEHTSSTGFSLCQGRDRQGGYGEHTLT
jgi:hypothetical protein